MTLEEENAALKTEIAQQREQIAMLLQRVRDLAARLVKDSHKSNSIASGDEGRLRADDEAL